MRKSFSLLLSVYVLLIFFTSCVPSSKELFWIFDNSIARITEETKAEFNKLLKKNGFDYTVNFVSIEYRSDNNQSEKNIPDHYLDGLQEYLDNGGKADLIFSGFVFSDQYVNAYLRLIQSGIYESLTPYLQTKDGNKLYEAFHPKFWESTEVAGQNYGVTSNISRPTYSSVFINNYYIDKYKIDVDSFPTDIWEWEPLLAKIKEGEKGRDDFFVMEYPFLSNSLYSYTNPVSALIAGVCDETEPTPIAVNLFEQEKAVKIFECLKRYDDEGYFGQIQTYKDGTLKPFDFALTVATGLSSDAEVENHLHSLFEEGGHPTSFQSKRLSESYAISLMHNINGIYSKSENKEKAFELLTLLATNADIANFLRYGKEGRDFEVQDGRAINVLTDSPQSFGLAFDPLVMGNEVITYPNEIQSKDKLSEYTALYSNATYSKHFGFQYDVKDTAPIIEACNMAVQEHYNLFYGRVDDVQTELEALNNDLQKAGLDTLLDEINFQLSEWRRGNSQ